MGCIVPTAMNRERDDQCMPYAWFVGIDWGSQRHQVCVLDRDRRRVGERVVEHDGASLARLADWSSAASTSLPLTPSNSTGSGTVTVSREQKTTDAMLLCLPIR